jgi:cell wall-associated NlpC family hydrolase
MTTLKICALSFFLLLSLSGTGCAAPGAVISKLGYSIQVGAFSEVRNAERLTSRLQDQGIEAFYFKKENGLFAVRFGDFPTRKEAQRTAKKVVAEQGIESYFIAPPLKGTLPEPRKPDLPRQQPPPATRSARNDMGNIAARTAERFIGIPYLWGGNTVVEGMDCSGFVRAVYNLCGVNIPRTSGEQFKVGRDVAREELVDGDLVFFGSSEQKISHVGIYVGNSRFVHAPRRGDEIKISSLQDNGFTKRYMGGRRYF